MNSASRQPGAATVDDLDTEDGTPGPGRAPTLIAVTLAVIAFAVVLRVRPGGEFVTRAFDDLGQLAAALIGAAGCWWRMRTCTGRARRSWALLAASLASWAAGEAMWSYYEVFARTESPFPSLADVGYLLFPALALPGLLVRPSAALAGRGWMRVTLDGAMVACSLFTISWATSLGSVYRAGAQSHFALAVGLAYPASDLIMLTVALLLFARARHRPGLGLLVAGIAMMAFADSGFAYLTAQGTYKTGSIVDVAWFAAFLGLGAAGVISPSREHAGHRSLESVMLLALPYVTVAAGALVSTVQIVRGTVDTVLLIVQGVAFAALIVRQMLTVLENRRLAEEVIAREAELRFRAFHDTLTGLANRALFHDRIAHALELSRRDGRRVQLLFCDLDDFKAVNDSLGHDAGDALLVAIAERLGRATRAGDTVARLGGDEFAILLEGDVDVERVAQRVLLSMAEPIELCGRTLVVGSSVGTATVGSDDESITSHELLKRADQAMYAAKAAGKGGCVSFTPNLGRRAGHDLDERIALGKDIRAGLMQTAVQPIVDAEGSPYALEALARWSYRGTEVAPEHFIPIADRLGLLADLDLDVAEAALEHVRSERAELLVAVNFGLTGRYARDMPNRIVALLDELRFPRDRLIAELPERGAYKDERIPRIIARLREAGIRVALDDFGTGQANLAQLCGLAPDFVKLDRSLVEHLGHSAAARRLVSGTIALAHDLGAVVVAAGVDTATQRDVLLGVGCDAMQGELFGAPELLASPDDRQQLIVA